MKIMCIGRNYGDHARELGNALPEAPVIFLKPDSAILAQGMPFFIPEFTRDLHYEVEVVVRVSRLGKHIAEEFASRYYQEVGIGIDFTARDLQNELKSKGLPWEKAKAFDGSAAVSRDFLSLEKMGKSAQNLSFELHKNGTPVQRGNTSDMLFGVDQIISHVSQYMTLKIGDLIFTGTPAGVGPTVSGDVLDCYLEGEKLLSVRVK